MRIREFHSELRLPHPPDELFRFFGDPANLECLTPSWLNFRILTPLPIVMGAGTLIDYRLRLRGVPMRWRTLIEVWEPPVRFIDVQLRGPYRLWRHEHLFLGEGGGTVLRDRVSYAVPLDFLVHRWLVRPDIERIFRFRAEVMRSRFGGRRGPS